MVSPLTMKLSGNTALSVHILLSHTVVPMSIYSLYGTPTSLTTSQISPASGVAYFWPVLFTMSAQHCRNAAATSEKVVTQKSR